MQLFVGPYADSGMNRIVWGSCAIMVLGGGGLNGSTRAATAGVDTHRTRRGGRGEA